MLNAIIMCCPDCSAVLAFPEISNDDSLQPHHDVDLTAFENQFNVSVKEAKKMEEESKKRIKLLEEEYAQMTAEKVRCTIG